MLGKTNSMTALRSADIYIFWTSQFVAAHRFQVSAGASVRADDRVTSNRTRVQSRAAPAAVRIVDQPSCATDVLFENEHMSAPDSNLVVTGRGAGKL